MKVENVPFLVFNFNEPANKYISMLAKNIILLHNAGITRSVAESRIIQVIDSTIKYNYVLPKGGD